jgi:hypothetical protein
MKEKRYTTGAFVGIFFNNSTDPSVMYWIKFMLIHSRKRHKVFKLPSFCRAGFTSKS